ncbi:MAG: hypothetical protein JWM80_398 [Cyanobacteria bacterium RYN_339]|nr:hypothetical protein [Cyanobacteria bacterium RYN_339]
MDLKTKMDPQEDPAAKFAHAIVSLGASGDGTFTRDDLAGDMPAFEWVDGLEEKDGKVSVGELALAMRHLKIHEPTTAANLEKAMERVQRRVAGLAALATAIGFGITAAGWAGGVSGALWARGQGYNVGAWAAFFLGGYFAGRSTAWILLILPGNHLRKRITEAKAAMLADLNSAFAMLPGAH